MANTTQPTEVVDELEGLAENNEFRAWLADASNAAQRFANATVDQDRLKDEICNNLYPMIIALGKQSAIWLQNVDEDLGSLEEVVEGNPAGGASDDLPREAIREFITKSADLALFVSLQPQFQENAQLQEQVKWLSDNAKTLLTSLEEEEDSSEDDDSDEK